jgi:predicted small integral membrane protein
MLDRQLKALFAALLGLMALFYVIQNIINLEQATGAIAYVLSLADANSYPKNLLPPVGPPLSTIVAWFVFLCEAATGVLLLLGGWRLWGARGTDAAGFESAKATAKLGAGLAVFTWFGLFATFGAAGYQMWQTATGASSMNGAFQFCTFALLLLVYLNQKD